MLAKRPKTVDGRPQAGDGRGMMDDEKDSRELLVGRKQIIRVSEYQSNRKPKNKIDERRRALRNVGFQMLDSSKTSIWYLGSSIRAHSF